MYQAERPRSVSPARAERAPSSEALYVEPAKSSGRPIVEPAPRVEAATENATSYVPSTTTKEKDDLSYTSLRDDCDFKCKASVSKGAPPKDIFRRILPWIFDERDFVAYGESLRFIVLKGSDCFVYLDEHAKSPLFAIPMQGITLKKENPKKTSKDSVTVSPAGNNNITSPFYETVLLRNKKGKLVFQFTFDIEKNTDLTSKFISAFEQASISSSKKITTVQHAQVIDVTKYEKPMKKI